MSAFLTELGRDVAIVNLDFANDFIPYEAAVDVRNLVKLEVLILHILLLGLSYRF